MTCRESPRRHRRSPRPTPSCPNTIAAGDRRWPRSKTAVERGLRARVACPTLHSKVIDMNRRRLLLLAGSALASARSLAWAQTTRTHRVAWLAAGSKADTEAYFDAFRAGLRDLGYQEGRNLVVDARFGDYTPARAEQLALKLAALRPEVLVTQGGAARQAEHLAPPIPTAFVFSGDPLVAGLATSLARPGRHLTGVCLLSLELVGKRMEILKEMVPKLSRVAIIANPDHPGEAGELGASKAAAERLGVRVSYYPI